MNGGSHLGIVRLEPVSDKVKANMLELLESLSQQVLANQIKTLIALPVLRDGSFATQIRGDIYQSELVGMLEFIKFDILTNARTEDEPWEGS